MYKFISVSFGFAEDQQVGSVNFEAITPYNSEYELVRALAVSFLDYFKSEQPNCVERDCCKKTVKLSAKAIYCMTCGSPIFKTEEVTLDDFNQFIVDKFCGSEDGIAYYAYSEEHPFEECTVRNIIKGVTGPDSYKYVDINMMGEQVLILSIKDLLKLSKSDIDHLKMDMPRELIRLTKPPKAKECINV